MVVAIANVKPLRVLLLEDDPEQAALVLKQLGSAGFDCATDMVSDWKHFQRLAAAGGYHVLVGDYELLGQPGPDAIRHLRQAGVGAPVILLTRGPLGDELAVACIQEGAADCVAKDRLHRLPAAMRRALKAAAAEARASNEWAGEEMRASEQQYASMMQSALDSGSQQAQRMEWVGRLAGGILHDFNNLLMIIRGCTELAERHKDDPDKIGKYIQQIHDTTSIAALGVQQLMTLSRKQAPEPTMLNLNFVLRDLGRVLRPLMGESIEVVFDYAAAPATVSGDRSKIEQIILSLALNSRDAMPYGGKITIEIANVVLSDALAAESGATLPPGSYVRLTIADTGVGMNREIKARIFEPLFTTKAEGKGSGLGLAGAYAIVKQAGGDIAVNSAPGRGTAFTIYFPAMTRKLAKGA